MKIVFLLLVFVAGLGILTWFICFVFSSQRAFWKNPLIAMILLWLFGLFLTGTFGWKWGMWGRFDSVINGVNCISHPYRQTFPYYSSWETIAELALCKGDIRSLAVWIALYSIFIFFLYRSAFRGKSWIVDQLKFMTTFPIWFWEHLDKIQKKWENRK